MIAAVAIGWALLAFPAVLRRQLSRLQPSTWSKLVAGSLVVGAGLIGIGLFTMAVPTLFEGVGAHHLAALCRRLIHDVLGGGHLGGSLAAGILAVIVYRACATVRRLRQARVGARIESWVGSHYTAEGHEIVIVPTDTLLAATPGGRSTQVIVSSGLVELLDDDELDLVLKHELSHLRRRHYRYLNVAAIVESALGWLPLSASAARVLRLGVERWADEEATDDDPTARRVLYTALLAASGVRPSRGLAGFGGLEMLKERLEGLKTDGVAVSTFRWYPAVVAVSATAAAAWVSSMAVLGISLVSSSYLCFI